MQGLLGLQGDQTSPSWRKSVLNIHWKDGCWSWSSNTLATWCEELTHWKRPWCWERLKTEEGDDRGWHGWMASLTQWTWIWEAQLAQCCSPGGHKESDTTEQLNNKRHEKIKTVLLLYFLVFLIYWWLRRKKRNTFFFFLETYRRETSPWSKKQMPAFHFFFSLSCMNEDLNFRKGTKTAPNQVQR